MPESTLEPPKRKLAPGMNQTGKTNGLALDAPWQDIRDAVATGLSMAKIAKQFAQYHPSGWQALHTLIRKRAQREGWLVPETAMAQAKERLEQSGVRFTEMSQARVTPPRDPEKTVTLMSQSLSEMGEEGSIIAGKLSLSLLRKAEANPEKIAPIVDSKDIATNIKTLRLVAGMDKQAPTISLNLWGQAGTHSGTSRDIAGDIRDIVEGEDE